MGGYTPSPSGRRAWLIIWNFAGAEVVRRDRKGVALLIGGCAALVQCGCVMGPKYLEASRVSYNEVIQRTTSQQLLLNLVRLKYREAPVFLEVGSVSAQFVFSQSGDISGTLNENIPMQPLNPDVLRIGGGITYQERPTITYTPLQGKDFVNRMMSPLPIETVLLLTRTGWRIDRVLPLTVQSMNGIDNASGASGPTPGRRPLFEEFLELAGLLQRLQSAGALELGAQTSSVPLSNPISADAVKAADLVAAAQAGYTFTATEDSKAYVLTGSESSLLWRTPAAAGLSEAIDGIQRLLGLEPGREQYAIKAGSGAVRNGSQGAHTKQSISINTRSLMGVMFYLSHAIEAPRRHIEAKLVTQTADEDGNPFDWNDVTGGLFRVHSSKWRPKGVAVRVRYREHWFYIDDADLDTKSTFALLGQLFALQAGEVASAAPVLTLPVGG